MLDYSNAQSSLLELVKLSPLTFDKSLSIEEFTELLIDPYTEKVWIYRNQEVPEEVKGFKNRILSGEDIMPVLELPLSKIKKGFRKKKK